MEIAEGCQPHAPAGLEMAPRNRFGTEGLRGKTLTAVPMVPQIPPFLPTRAYHTLCYLPSPNLSLCWFGIKNK